MKIVFMGTPDLAAEVLDTMMKNGCEVTLAVTQPDRPKGRGRGVIKTPVHECADRWGIPVFSPVKVKTPDAVQRLREEAPDLIVVAAFGQILSKEILELPRYGCVNVHASLLPKYRGAAPIQWAIANGEKVTGVTAMQMDAGMDTGDILRQKKVPISIDDTTEILMDKLAVAGNKLLLETIEDYVDGKIEPLKQDEDKVTLSPPVKPEDAVIDWNTDARKVHDKIRALCGWPGASTVFDGKRVKIYASRLETDSEEAGEPGEITVAHKADLKVKCASGSVYILELQSEGGKRLKAIDCAHNYKPGQRFGV